MASAQSETATNTTPDLPPSTTTESVSAATVTNNSSPRRVALNATAQVRLTNLCANISNRLDAYVRRIGNVTARLDSRSTKMAAEGLDVSAANSKIAEANSALDRARAALATIDIEVAAFVGSENPKERWSMLKSKYATVKDDIKAAHKATVEAVLLLKTASATSANNVEAS